MLKFVFSFFWDLRRLNIAGYLFVVFIIRFLEMDAEGRRVWEESFFRFFRIDFFIFWSLF